MTTMTTASSADGPAASTCGDASASDSRFRQALRASRGAALDGLPTAANAAVAPIHDRMPAILEGDSLALWLNPRSEAHDLPGPLTPARDGVLEARAVSMAVNDAKHDGPELIAG